MGITPLRPSGVVIRYARGNHRNPAIGVATVIGTGKLQRIDGHGFVRLYLRLYNLTHP